MKERPFKSYLSSKDSHQSCEVSSGGNQTETINYRDQFKTFLRKERFSEYGAERFLEALSFVDFYISMIITPNHRTVFEISDADILTKYHSALMEDFSFVTKDRSKGRQLGRALLEYIEFAKILPSVEQPAPQEQSKEEASAERLAMTTPDDTLVKATVAMQNKRQELIRQAQAILQPIEEYLNEYQIDSIVKFEYHGAFQDVDVFSPRFKKDLNTEAEELCELVSLMKKYGVFIPASLRERQGNAKELKELKDTIRSFENWVVGYMAYLPLNKLEVDSISYAPDEGFKIALSGKGIESIVVKMKTSLIGTGRPADSKTKKK